MGVIRSGVVLVAVLAAASGCTSGPEVDAEPVSGFATSASCRAAQGDVAWLLQTRMQRVTSAVLSSPGETRDGAAVPVREALAIVERRSERVCGGGSTPLVALVELAYSRADEVVDEALLRQLVAAFEEWASAVGRPRFGRIHYYADPCVPMDRAIRVSYEVRRQAEPGGVRAWVEITVTNEWERLYLSHSGAIRATGVAPGGRARTFHWGGSSADTAAAPLGRTTSFAVWPATLRDEFVHLLPGGTVRVQDVDVWAHSGLAGCRLTVSG